MNNNNPHLKSSLSLSDFNNFIITTVRNYIKKANKPITILDVGGGKGWGKHLYSMDQVDYYALDINSNSNLDSNITYVKGDITDPTLDLNQEFDIIFTKDTFEHILNPWESTQNILNHLKENGLFIFCVPFSWRYHPSPYDTYRYTHTGAQYMFTRLGGMKTIDSRYVYFGDINGFWPNKKDHTMDGQPFPKCIELIYIGERDSTYEFNTSDLDSDFSWDHKS